MKHAIGYKGLDTARPRDSAASRFHEIKEAVAGTISAAVSSFKQRLELEFVAGETIDDAMRVAGRLLSEGLRCTLAYWPPADSSDGSIADIYRAAIDNIGPSGLGSYLSIKPLAMRFDFELAAKLAAEAKNAGVRLHCDSHGIETADQTIAFMDTMLLHLSPGNLGMSLPGRWSRSLDDAQWIIEQGLNARVVKGEWPDPADPHRDMRAGFLKVIDRLAGRAAHVAVATHDMPLAIKAIERLQSTGTSCELEFTYGVPVGNLLEWACENKVPARIYVPYGNGYIPCALNLLRRNPRVAWTIVKGVLSKGY
jgi:proline dehydrogenase